MKTSKRALQFIKDHEGLRLKSYKDAVGVWTIGYGHTSDSFFTVEKGQTITNAKANELLEHDVLEAEAGIDKVLKEPLPNGNMYGAVVSLVFNIGIGAFGQSTLLRKLNKKDYTGAANEFGKWVKGTVKGKKKTLPGLVRRRAEEKALFMTPDKLSNKVVNQPKITFVTEETAEAREVKGQVFAPKSLPKGSKETAGGLVLAWGLGEYLNVWNQVKDYVGDYAPYILGGIVATAVIGFGIRYFKKVD